MLPGLPARRGARRRDRHGRGLRGPLLNPVLPGWRTRSEKFDQLVASAAARLLARNPGLAGTEFGVEEIPPSDPSPWEHRAVALGRAFPADRATGARQRIVVYRRPVMTRASGRDDLMDLVRMVLAEQAAGLLSVQPWDVEPDYPKG
ncbi:MAG TPA: metallopeptidase family protein [Actinomycetaceae bacterium]|nr:metallopeptidase family protein [Actinomycetaceae bacterium]